MNNIEIRTMILANGLKHYQVAGALGWSESKLSALLREPLTEKDHSLIKKKIEQMASNKKGA